MGWFFNRVTPKKPYTSKQVKIRNTIPTKEEFKKDYLPYVKQDIEEWLSSFDRTLEDKAKALQDKLVGDFIGLIKFSGDPTEKLDFKDSDKDNIIFKYTRSQYIQTHNFKEWMLDIEIVSKASISSKLPPSIGRTYGSPMYYSIEQINFEFKRITPVDVTYVAYQSHPNDRELFPFLRELFKDGSKFVSSLIKKETSEVVPLLFYFKVDNGIHSFLKSDNPNRFRKYTLSLKTRYSGNDVRVVRVFAARDIDKFRAMSNTGVYLIGLKGDSKEEYIFTADPNIDFKVKAAIKEFIADKYS